MDRIQESRKSQWIGFRCLGENLAEWASVSIFAVLLYSSLAYASDKLGAPLLWSRLGAAMISLSGLVLFCREGIVPFKFREHSRRVSYLIVAVSVLALAARLHTFLKRPLWDDEMWTMHIVYGGTLKEVLAISVRDFWPPLHYVVVNIFARILDTSVFSLRLPSLLAGVLTVATLPVIGRLLFKRVEIGLFAGLLLALAVPHVLFSQMARVYALQVFLGTLASYYFYKSFLDARVSAAHVVITTLFLYCHTFSWYLVAAHWVFLAGAVLFFDMKACLRSAVRAQGAIFVLYVPLAMAFLYARYVQHVDVPFTWVNGTGQISLRGILMMFASLSVRSAVGAACLAILAVLLGLAVYRDWRRANLAPTASIAAPCDIRMPVMFLASWVLVPAVVSLAVSVLTPMRSFGPVKYHLFMLPGICMLAAAGLFAVRSRICLIMAFATIAAVGVGDLQKYYREFDYAHFDEAARFVKGRIAPDELVYAGNGFRAFSYYYNDQHPRIGSRGWDDFAAQFAGLDKMYVDGSGRPGYSYSSEKMLGLIRYLYKTPREDFIHGRLQAPFWVVVGEEGERQYVHAAINAGLYRHLESSQFKGGVEVLHLGAPSPVSVK
jgi:hypothetical protein